MAKTTFAVVGYNPFTVLFINGNKRKKVQYKVALTKQEIQAEAEYVVFDEPPAVSPGQIDLRKDKPYRQSIHLFTNKEITEQQVIDVAAAIRAEIVMFGDLYMLIGDDFAKQVYDKIMEEGKAKEAANKG